MSGDGDRAANAAGERCMAAGAYASQPSARSATIPTTTFIERIRKSVVAVGARPFVRCVSAKQRAPPTHTPPTLTHPEDPQLPFLLQGGSLLLSTPSRAVRSAPNATSADDRCRNRRLCTWPSVPEPDRFRVGPCSPLPTAQGMPTKYGKTFAVPKEFPSVLKAFTREVLRAQPDDIYEFGSQYFTELLAQAEAAQAAQDSGIRRLSPEELEQLLAGMFHEADADGSGALSLKEFKVRSQTRARAPTRASLRQDKLLPRTRLCEGPREGRGCPPRLLAATGSCPLLQLL
jgi:hypothetical protein